MPRNPGWETGWLTRRRATGASAVATGGAWPTAEFSGGPNGTTTGARLTTTHLLNSYWPMTDFKSEISRDEAPNPTDSPRWLAGRAFSGINTVCQLLVEGPWTKYRISPKDGILCFLPPPSPQWRRIGPPEYSRNTAPVLVKRTSTWLVTWRPVKTGRQFLLELRFWIRSQGDLFENRLGGTNVSDLVQPQIEKPSWFELWKRLLPT